MSATLRKTVHEIVVPFVPTEAAEEALRAIGDRADLSLDAMSSEKKAFLISHFVRNLHAISVERATMYERLLLQELDAGPSATKLVVLKDAISVITARNHVHHVSTHLGMSWADSMKLQSAISEVVRYAVAHHGGVLQTTSAVDHVEFVITVADGHGAKDWLAAVKAMVGAIDVHPEGAGARVEFRVRKTEHARVA